MTFSDLRGLLLLGVIVGMTNCAVTSTVCQQHLVYLVAEATQWLVEWAADQSAREVRGEPKAAPAPTQHQIAPMSVWEFRNGYRRSIHIRFFSERSLWPSREEVYVLNAGETRDYHFACLSDEIICYGAWPASGRSVIWGAGRSGKSSCGDCCQRCGTAASPTIILLKVASD